MPGFWKFIKNQAAEGAAAGAAEEVELHIDGEIIDDDSAWLYKFFGIQAASPNTFKTELANYKGQNITVWINSYGGDVFAGAGMYLALKEHKGNVTVKVEKAVSAASVIAMAGTEIRMSPVGIMMIHNPIGHVSWAEAKDFRHAADVLDEVKQTIMNAYQMKTKRSRNKISELMDNETWMSAKTALSEGFIDGILYTDTQPQQAVENSFMFSRLAIQNSVSESMKRFTEQYKDKFPQNDPTPPLIPKPEESQQSLVNLYTKIKTRNERRKTHV